MAYDNTNKGVLFKNKKKETDKHPDYNGSININGQDFWLSAWINESKQKEKYMSLSVKPKDEQTRQQPTDDFVEDDIPF